MFFLDYYAAKIRFYTEQIENIPYFCTRKRAIIMLTTIFLVFFLTIVASFIQRVTGFGFGIFVMMFFPYILPTFGECITLSGLLAGTTSLLIALRNWRYIRWRLIGTVLLFNIVASYIAIEYMASLSNAGMKCTFGMALILIALYFLFFDGRLKMLGQSRPAQAGVGIVSGIMGGMFAMPGPPIVLYSIGVIGDKREYVATLQALFFTLNVFYTLFRLKVGFFADSTLTLWVFGLLGCFLGAWAGARFFHLISLPLLKKIVYLLMIVSGMVAVW